MDSVQNSDHLYKRMVELKEMYDSKRKELGISGPIKSKLSSVEASEDEGHSSEFVEVQEEYEDDKNAEGNLDSRTKKRKVVTKIETKTIVNNSMNQKDSLTAIPHYVQMLPTHLKMIIEKHGGSCHLETLVENIKVHWQREGFTKYEGVGPYGHADCKKYVTSVFKNKGNLKFTFIKDKENEGCWSVIDDEHHDGKQEALNGNGSVAHKYKSLAESITDGIEEHGGMCHLEDICTYLKENWKAAPLPQGNDEFTAHERDHQILLTLATNPKFFEDGDNPDFYQVHAKKKRKGTGGAGVGGGLPGDDKRVKDPRKKMIEDEFSPQRARNPRRAVRDDSAPNGFTCRCGATEPGGTTGGSSNAKWKRGSNGEYQCNNCIASSNKKLACPVCGKMYKRENEADDHENSWIRCDDCHRWVMTKCDNLYDLSIYDDGNPNHLHYSCPICRKDKVGIFLKGISKETNNSNTNKKSAKSNGKTTNSNVNNNGTSHTATSTSTTTVQVKEESLLEYEELYGKLEAAEKEIMDKLSEGNEIETSMIEDDELRERIETHENTFGDDMAQYSAQLIGKRDRERYKNQQELERQIKKIREEKEKRDELMELDLVAELKSHFRKEKKEFDKQREKILKMKGRLKDY